MPKRNVTPSPLTSPQESGKPSSGINVNEILQLAEEIDRVTEAEPDEKPKRGKAGKGKTTNKVTEVFEPQVEVAPPPDPEFVAMCNWGVGAGVDACKIKFDWTEPGVHWRIKVAECFARIIDRLRPMQPGPLTDLLTASGYVGLWVVSNVSANRTSKGKTSDRVNGVREDLETPGPATT